MKGRRIAWTPLQLSFIKRRKKWERARLHAAFIKRFPRRRDVSLEALKQLCSRKGWRTGRDGCFKRGHVPANKGGKMPYNANSARTRFQKGSRTGRAAENYKPIGSERLSKEGYRERKIHDGLPMQSRWKSVHRVEWERVNGPVPAGAVLKCKGDKLDTDPSNWELVPRALLPRLNGKSGRGYDGAPADLKPAIMAVAKLEHRLREARSASVPK